MQVDGLNPFKDPIRKLTPHELRNLTQYLPAPLSVWAYDDVRFEVYLPKQLFNPRWGDESLYQLLIDARGSYYVYGDRPPLDNYDAKSAPYLVRVIYPHISNGQEVMAEEWVSDRLVPLTGKPLGSGELEFFEHDKKGMEILFQEKFFGVRSPGYHRFFTVTSNRLCGIAPYAASASDDPIFSPRPNRLKYTGICYVLICKHFSDDYLDLAEALYSTSIIHNKVLEKSMTFEKGSKLLRVEFAPAWQIFGFAGAAEIRLNRYAHDSAAYQFSHYFLDSKKLVICLEELLNRGALAIESFHRYCGANAGAQNKIDPPFEQMRYLGNLLNVNGPIFGSSLTGKELRGIINAEVPDGPELKITAIETIRENTKNLIAELGIHRMD